MLKYLAGSVLAGTRAAVEPMVTIEIVSKPDFLDFLAKYFYLPALALIIIFIIYRKLKVK